MILAALLATAAAAVTPVTVDAQLRAVAALLGEPRAIGAAGVTADDRPILSIENSSAFDPASSQRRLVILGSADDDRSAAKVIDIVRWLKKNAPARIRREWAVSAMPAAAVDAKDAASLERWVTFQAPDVLVEVRGDASVRTFSSMQPQRIGSDETPAAILKLLSAAPPGRSLWHDTIAKRVARDPLDIARLLAKRYPETPSISYIPSVAWVSSLRLTQLTGDESFAQKVREQTAPWVSGAQPLFGNRIQLTAIAGTMVFVELGSDEALVRARDGAALALKRKADGLAEYGQGWTDDMFMTAAILARVRGDDRSGYVHAAAQLLIDYAGRLQRPDGVFIHATDGPFAWGRGNGFAALGLMEVLTSLPTDHRDRARLLRIYQRQMTAVRALQSPDGSWRQVIDEPGAYREETATAMLMTAMARGVRLGWLDRSYLPVVERAWRALAAHVGDDGTLVDVCTGTGAGPTKRYYLDRQAITGNDDRGGAMALLASVELEELRRLSSRPRAASSSAGRSVR